MPLGGAKVTPAVTEVFLRARRIAEAEGSLTGVQHVFLALLYCPTFYKILVNSGCDVELFKEYDATQLPRLLYPRDKSDDHADAVAAAAAGSAAIAAAAVTTVAGAGDVAIAATDLAAAVPVSHSAVPLCFFPLSVSPSVCLPLSFSFCLPVSVSLSLYLSLPFFSTVCLCGSLFISLFRCACIAASLFLSLSPSFSVCDICVCVCAHDVCKWCV